MELLHETNKLRDQVEGSTSSSITVRSYTSENQIFDPGDQIDDDESRLTEPTSISSDEVPSNMQETKMNVFSIMEKSATGEDALLFSNLDIYDRSIENELKDVSENEHLEDRNEVLDLDNADVPPKELVTTALNDFVPVEASLRQPLSPIAGASAPALRCVTEESAIDSVDEIHLGLHDRIWRWKRNSQIRFNVNSRSFPPRVDMRSAKEALEVAAREWNTGLLGVQFVPAFRSQDVVFQLTYGGDGGGDEGILAESFIPRRPETLQRPQKLLVYPLLFKKKNFPNMTNVFYHELGHILGLRHEFAPLREKARSVQWGPSNSHSVMNYYEDWSLCHIHAHDVASVREFYSFKGTEYRGFKIYDLDPDRFGPEPSPAKKPSLPKRSW